MEQFLTDEDLGIGTQATPTPQQDPLVQAPPLALADMAKQNQPVRFQGKDVYKDPQGNFRYGSLKKAAPTFLSDADLGITKPEPTFTDKAVDYAKTSAKNAIGSTAVLMDMLAGLPGMAMNAGAYAMARANLAAMGEDSKIGAKAAEEIAADLVPEAISAPFHKIMKSLGYEDVYNESTVGQAMNYITGKIEQGSDWASEQTKGGLQPADVKALVNVGMAAMGAKGGDVALKRALITKEQLRTGEQVREARKTYADEPAPGTVVGTATPDGQALTPEALAKQHVEARYADPTLEGPAAAQFWKERGQEMRNTFEDKLTRAQYEKAKRALVAERKKPKSPAVVVEEKLAADPPREGTPQEILKQYKEEVLGEGKAAPISEGDATRLYQIPPVQRTAEQRLQIKRYEDSLRTQGQAGTIDPDLLVKLGAGSLTLAGIGYLAQQEGGVSDLPAIAATFIPVAVASPLMKRAEALKKLGAPREEIWRLTGAFENSQGKWLREVSDAESKILPNAPKLSNDPRLAKPLVSSILEHPKLYEAAPYTADVPVQLGKPKGGMIDQATGVMSLGANTPEGLRSVAGHELQHIVQRQEGMPRGGSPNHFLSEAQKDFIKEADAKVMFVADEIAGDIGEFSPDYVKQAIEQMQRGGQLYDRAVQEFNKVRGHPMFPKLVRALEDRILADDLYKGAIEKYKTVAGEVEARAVQKRLNMTELERRNTPPWESYDVPESAWTFLDKPSTKVAAAALAGGWMFLDQEDAERIGVGSLVALGAIKGKGGMWHPEAVRILARPLEEAISRGIRNLDMRPGADNTAAIAAAEAARSWTDSRVKNWLNKHAGTATDPLKDVKVPMLGDDVRWEDLTDRLIHGYDVVPFNVTPKHGSQVHEGTMGAKAGERIWDMASTNVGPKASAVQAIQSYLSHVGDYLREFVPADKLQQYDLVRAVKETARQDEIQAAKMAKARVNQAGIVDYKVYPDGMKWVEVGKVADEGMPKGYRIEKVQDASGVDGYKVLKDGEHLGKDVDLRDVGPDDFPPRFASMEEAAYAARQHVADQALKNEGDVMGHCVGGYCEMVHSGESKIYSLRDEKGMSHVTVEVRPQSPTVDLRELTGNFRQGVVPREEAIKVIEDLQYDPDFGKGTKDATGKTDLSHWIERLQQQDIMQIKGKQNRAPVDKYLPYVQDFVKSGKWGEVGDLENAGLISWIPERGMTQPEVYKFGGPNPSDVADVLGGPGYYTPKEVHEAYKKLGAEEDPRFPWNQRGSIDPDLAKKLGAGAAGAAIGAYLDKDERLGGALAGGVLGVIGATAMARPKGRNIPTNRGLDYLGGNLSTRVGNLGEMGEAIKLRLRGFEAGVMRETKAVTDKVGPFLKDLKGLPGVVKEQVSLALLQQDFTKVRQLLAGSSQMVRDFDVVQQVLKDFETVHKQLGRFKQGITDYFPRIVADYEGLQKHLGTQAASNLDDWLNKAEKAMIKAENRLLTPVEESILINRYLLAEAPLSSLPPHLRQRTVKQVTAALQPFYEAPEVSLSRYVHAAVQDIEMAKLFGKNLKLSKASHGTRAINIDESIGAFVRDAKQAGHLTSAQEAQLKEILTSRFGPGEQGARPGYQHIRNVANMGLLGNFVSAATQLSDMPMAYYAFHLRSTLSAVGKTLTGKAIDPRDFGLANHISEEFATAVSSAKALQKMFKYSGFSAVDMAGKKIILNAALDRYQRMAQTPKGQARIAEKYQAAFGSDFADLMRDLRNKTKSENTDLLLFSELSDLQPVSKMEMPQAYLDMPNGRLVYMLKSFMLKQVDIVRRDMFQEFVKPGLEHKQRALANLTRYAITVGVAGATVQMVKDLILGKPLKAPEWDDVALNLVKTFGWSKYTIDKAKSGRPMEAVVGIVMPPYAMFDDIIRRDPKAIAYLPPVGKIVYERKKDEWKEERAWERKHDPALRLERRMKRLEEHK